MTTIQRRLYLLVFVILFFLTAPIIVLFAQGYRFDSVNNIFVHSGSITIKSVPRDIEIFVDGKERKKSSLSIINGSYTINGIRPGTHTITCKKEGYTTWSKKVNVHSGISTEFWNILLFPLKSLEGKNFAVENVTQFFLSPRNNDEVVIFSEKDEERIVSLLNTVDNSLTIIYQTSEFTFLPQEEKENVEWSSDHKSILIPFMSSEGEKTFVIAQIARENLEEIVILNDFFEIDAKTLKETSNEELTKNGATTPVSTDKIAPITTQKEPIKKDEMIKTKTVEVTNSTKQDQDINTVNGETLTLESVDLNKFQFKQVRWMFNKNNELVVLTKNHELIYINIEKPDERILLDTEVGGFDFAGNRIYYFHLADNSIWEIKNNDVGTKKQIASLLTITDKDSFVKMITYDQYRITILTPDKKLFLFNHEKEEGEISIKELSDGIEDVQFSDDGKKLLYWSKNEIWYTILRDWDVQPIRKKGDKALITRSSTPIYNVQWIEDYENILFTIGDTVKSSGIDVRDHIEIVNVQKNENILNDRDIIYDKDTQTLYRKDSFAENKPTTFHSEKLIDRGGFLGL
jgi:hypothetical protein